VVVRQSDRVDDADGVLLLLQNLGQLLDLIDRFLGENGLILDQAFLEVEELAVEAGHFLELQLELVELSLLLNLQWSLILANLPLKVLGFLFQGVELHFFGFDLLLMLSLVLICWRLVVLALRDKYDR
jgi:hypothetical protein